MAYKTDIGRPQLRIFPIHLLWPWPVTDAKDQSSFACIALMLQMAYAIDYRYKLLLRQLLVQIGMWRWGSKIHNMHSSK